LAVAPDDTVLIPYRNCAQNPTMFDTHCHLTFPEFRGRTAEILAQAQAAGVRGAITISTTSADCLRTAELASQFPNLWCSAGVHPLYSHEPIDWTVVRQAATNPKCVAWGELGLDNHYDHPPRAIQDQVLAEQLAVIQASEADLPIIIHCREAYDDLLTVLRGTTFNPSRFVFHCFTGTPDEARKLLDFGAWISFTGIVTFQNAREIAEAAKLVPADRIVVETDSPFLTPEPMRKVRPNEPKYVVHTAQYLAKLRNVDATEFEQQLDQNAERFFAIKIP
jgi:TatD DNase family protein